jgi:5'-3' exonuclease
MLKSYAELLKQIRVEHEQGSSGINKDSRVLIVDGTNSFIRVFSAVPLVNDDGDHIGGSIGFLRSIAAVIRQFNPTRCIIVFDGKGGASRRRKINSNYKENRTVNTRFRRSEEVGEMTVEQEMESMKRQYGMLVSYLECLPITCISIDNIEADDTIAYLTTEYFRPKGSKVTIMSDDKDFLQLVNENTQVWRPVQKKMFNQPEVLEKFGVPSHNYIHFKVFIGDASDNVRGVDGIGPKTLIKRIPVLLEDKQLEIDDVFDYCRNKLSEHKVYQQILDAETVIRQNYAIMNLEDLDIAGTFKSLIRDLADADTPTFNKLKFKQVFMLDKAYTAIPNVDSWLQNSFSALAGYANK